MGDRRPFQRLSDNSGQKQQRDTMNLERKDFFRQLAEKYAPCLGMKQPETKKFRMVLKEYIKEHRKEINAVHVERIEDLKKLEETFEQYIANKQIGRSSLSRVFSHIENLKEISYKIALEDVEIMKKSKPYFTLLHVNNKEIMQAISEIAKNDPDIKQHKDKNKELMKEYQSVIKELSRIKERLDRNLLQQ
jgi:hypothetical protein